MKPVLQTVHQLGAIVEDMKAGILSGDTDEGSIEFTLPVMEDWLHESELPADPAEREKWQVVQDDRAAAIKMYEPKREYVWVQASYRTGRTMGQGGLRMVGVL